MRWWRRAARPAAPPKHQRIEAPYGATYRDGGILDFGREHAYLINERGCTLLLPQSLVNFIAEQSNKEHLKGLEHGIGANTGGDSDTDHGQARQGQGDADGAGVARPPT